MESRAFVDLTDDSEEVTVYSDSSLKQLNNNSSSSHPGAPGPRVVSSHDIDQYVNTPIQPHQPLQPYRLPYAQPLRVKYEPKVAMIPGQPEPKSGVINNMRILPPNIIGAGVDAIQEYIKKMKAFQQMHQKPTYAENSNYDKKYYPPGWYSELDATNTTTFDTIGNQFLLFDTYLNLVRSHICNQFPQPFTHPYFWHDATLFLDYFRCLQSEQSIRSGIGS